MSTLTAVHVPATRPTRPVRPAAPLRLTRRGRLVFFSAALLLVMGVVLGLGLALGGSAASEEAGEAPVTTLVTVGTGETLWDIAGELAADGVVDGDLRSVMAHIEELNDLDSAMLIAGQELRVPVAE